MDVLCVQSNLQPTCLFITSSHHHASLWDGANSQTSKLHHSAVVVHPALSNRWPSGLNPPTCWSRWSKKISLPKTAKLIPCNGLTPGNSWKLMLNLQNTFPQHSTNANNQPFLIKGFSALQLLHKLYSKALCGRSQTIFMTWVFLEERKFSY